MTERDQLFCNRYSCRSLYQRRNKWHLTLYTSLPSDLKEMTWLNICRGSDVTWEHVYLLADDSADCQHSHRNDMTIVSRCKKSAAGKMNITHVQFQSEIYWKNLIWIHKPLRCWPLISWYALGWHMEKWSKCKDTKTNSKEIYLLRVGPKNVICPKIYLGQCSDKQRHVSTVLKIPPAFLNST